MKWLILVMVASLLLLSSGCGSILAWSDNRAPKTFGGVRMDYEIVARTYPSAGSNFVMWRFYRDLRYLDFPLSLLVDVVMLPFAIVVDLIEPLLPDR